VLRRKLPAFPDRPHHYAKLPRRVWQDPRLHRGAVASLAAILCAAAGRPAFPTLTRSLATAARVCERTMHNHLKLLAAAGYLVLHRVGRRGPLLVTLTGMAVVRHRPLPPEVEAVWEARRSGHPEVHVSSYLSRRFWSCGWRKSPQDSHTGNHNSKIAGKLGGARREAGGGLTCAASGWPGSRSRRR
jgi:hypothetical protein